MAVKMLVSGAQKVTHQLRGLSLTGKSYLTGRVTYNTPYAVWVHEDLTKYHAPPTSAKFLEIPARTLRPQMKLVVTRKLKAKRSLEDAIYAAMQLLFDASQQLVPVATGRLRASGRIEVR